MKKIFAFAIAFVSMVVSMTSCGNDNTDFIEQKPPVPAPTAVSITTTTTSFDESTPDPEFDGNIYFAVSEHQNEYISSNYTIQVGDQTMTVNIEDLSVATSLPENIENYFVRCERKDDFVRPTIYVYHIPAEMSGKVNVTANLTVKEGVELPAVLDVWGGAATNVRSQFYPCANTTRNAMADNLAKINGQKYIYDITK